MTTLHRLAQAMMDARSVHSHPFPILNGDPDFNDTPDNPDATDDGSPFTQSDILALVRAVLVELKDPTEAMVTAGFNADGIGCDHPKCVFKAMINAALEENF